MESAGSSAGMWRTAGAALLLLSIPPSCRSACDRGFERTADGSCARRPEPAPDETTPPDETGLYPYDGPIVLHTVSVSCGSHIWANGETKGLGSDAAVLLVHTAGAFVSDEEHTLRPTWVGDYEYWQKLQAMIEMDSASSSDGRSAYNCDHVWNHELTHAMVVWDSDGSFADCIAWGHDAPGLLADAYILENAARVDAEVLAACND